jgi:hypothetical protein
MYEASIPEFSFRKTGVCNVITKKIFAKYVLNSDLRPQMWVWFRENAGLGETKLGRWLEVSHRVGTLMQGWKKPLFWIWEVV